MKKRTIFIVGLATLLYNCAVYLLYYFESTAEEGNILNLKDAYWYSIVTLTTVGYGDFYPLTFWGRTIGFLFVLGSLGILGLLVTELSLGMSNYIRKKKEGYFGTKMENHCIIIGWDSFSQQVAQQIVKANKDLAVITDKREDIDKIQLAFPKGNCFALLTDLKKYENFSKVNIEKAERVYLNFKDDSETLVYAINLKKTYPDITCVVALDNMELKSTFTYMGVEFVISKNEIASKLIASFIFEPNAALIAEDLLATSTNDDELDIWEQKIDKGSKLQGKNYFEAFVEFKQNYNSVLLGVSRKGELYKNPNHLLLQTEDVLVFVASEKEYRLLQPLFL
ncbi:potassium channel family protein [Aquimarina brevivitae]|uniref:Voltage-gated potassium channel n=1 Tax=Aquimarina brevivitae TaxID=323412 RepID=A0A4Q7PHW3_9FLAO|nr:ion channel [Aquimarina brevivitae]RZT00006.1 voltage-gated potassium channel [Aquimarina brevivitae]